MKADKISAQVEELKTLIERKERNMNEEFNMERFQDINQYVQFNYNNPYPNFNRSQVLGRVAALFKIKDSQQHSLALQVLGGYRL